MDLPFSIDQNASVLLMKANYNSLVDKLTSKNYQNLLKNHDLKHVVSENDAGLTSLKDWKSEEVAKNSTTNGFFNSLVSGSGFTGTNFVYNGNEFAALGVANTTDKKLYQDFTVSNINTSDKLTVVAVYKLARYQTIFSITQFDKFVEKGFTDQLMPLPDLLMDVYKTGTADQPLLYTNMTGVDCKSVDSKTFIDVKQYTLSDDTFNNLTLKISATNVTTYTSGLFDYHIIPAIIGFYVYNANVVIPGLVDNVDGIENDIKYENGKWQLTNDGKTFKSLINYEEVKVGTTQDAEFATLTLAKAHVSNSGLQRKYILTSNITEAGIIAINNNTEIDGRGFTITGAQSLL